jgi:hypothetical protein
MMSQDGRRKKPEQQLRAPSPAGSRIGRGEPTKALSPHELAQKLEPKLAELYLGLPITRFSRIAELYAEVPAEFFSGVAQGGKRVRLAQITPDRVLKYAVLVAAAEKTAQEDVSTENEVRARAELLGKTYGFEEGYHKPAEARSLDKRGRRARQQIEASLQGAEQKWQNTEQVIRKHRSEIPLHLQEVLSDERLAVVEQSLRDMRRTVALPPKKKSGRQPRRRPRELTVASQTFLWWHHILPSYRGKWNDMHRLAGAWGLSNVQDVETFRILVKKQVRKITTLHFPFGGRWRKILSENP